MRFEIKRKLMELNQQIILQSMTAVVHCYKADVVKCWGKLDQIPFLSSAVDSSIHNALLPLKNLTHKDSYTSYCFRRVKNQPTARWQASWWFPLWETNISMMGYKFNLYRYISLQRWTLSSKIIFLPDQFFERWKQKKIKIGAGCSSVVKYTLSMHIALVLISCMRERKEEKGRKEGGRKGGKIGYQMK